MTDYFDFLICGDAETDNRVFLRAPGWSGIEVGETVGYRFPGTNVDVEDTVLSVATIMEDSNLYKSVTAAFPKNKVMDVSYVLHKKSFRED